MLILKVERLICPSCGISGLISGQSADELTITRVGSFAFNRSCSVVRYNETTLKTLGTKCACKPLFQFKFCAIQQPVHHAYNSSSRLWSSIDVRDLRNSHNPSSCVQITSLKDGSTIPETDFYQLCDLLATAFRESFAMNFSRCLTFGAKSSGSRDAITSNRIISSVKRALGRLITHGL
jgi:hypothetical protein